MSIRDGMPLLAKHEGYWEGEYVYLNPQGEVIDRHRSHLACLFPDPESGFDYDQTNTYTWPDGRTEQHHFPWRDGQPVLERSERSEQQTPDAEHLERSPSDRAEATVEQVETQTCVAHTLSALGHTLGRHLFEAVRARHGDEARHLADAR